MLTRSRSVMQRRTIPTGNSNSLVFANFDNSRIVHIQPYDYEEMGSPQTITVTIRPGDRLNK